MAYQKTLEIDIEEEAATLLECENGRMSDVSSIIEDVHKYSLDLHTKLGSLCSSIKTLADVFKRATSIFSNDDSNIPCVITAKNSSSKMSEFLMFIYDTLKFNCSSIEDCSVTESEFILSGSIKKARESYDVVKKERSTGASLLTKSARKQLTKHERDAIKLHMDASLESMVHIPKVLSVYQDSLARFFTNGKILADEMKAYSDTFLKEVKEFEEANVESKDKFKESLRLLIQKEQDYNKQLGRLVTFQERLKGYTSEGSSDSKDSSSTLSTSSSGDAIPSLPASLSSVKLVKVSSDFPSLNISDIRTIFGNIEEIKRQHDTMLKDLVSATKKKEKDSLYTISENVSRVVAAAAPLITDIYIPYIEDLSLAFSRYNDKFRGCKGIKTVLKECGIKKIRESLALPSTHFVECHSILSSIATQTPREYRGRTKLSKANEALYNSLELLDEAKKHSDRISDLLREDLPSKTLIDGSRVYICVGEVKLASSPRDKASTHRGFDPKKHYVVQLILFNDMIVLYYKPHLKDSMITVKLELHKTFFIPIGLNAKRYRFKLVYNDIQNGISDIYELSVSKENSFNEWSKTIQNAINERNKTQFFGVSISEIMKRPEESKQKIPKVLSGLIAFIRNRGLQTEGVFRLSSNRALEEELKNKIDAGHPIHLVDPIVAGALIKLWLRELPFQLTVDELYSEWVSCAEDPEKLKECVQKLPEENRNVLFELISLCVEIEKYNAFNKMKVSNLATCLAQCLFYKQVPESGTAKSSMVNTSGNNRVVEMLITNYTTVFEDMVCEQSTQENALMNDKISKKALRRKSCMLWSLKNYFKSNGEIEPENVKKEEDESKQSPLPEDSLTSAPPASPSETESPDNNSNDDSSEKSENDKIKKAKRKVSVTSVSDEDDDEDDEDETEEVDEMAENVGEDDE